MADVRDIEPDLLRLDEHLDSLEQALQPLLGDLEGLSSQLPLLDKAKFFSLAAYAIDSLVFSALKLEGTDAQNHAVFSELKRVQQYFAKIKAIETPEEATRNLTVNQEAAARLLKADLADNKTIASKLAEKVAEERAKALLRSVENRKRPADSPAPSTASASDAPEGKSKKKQRKRHRAK